MRVGIARRLHHGVGPQGHLARIDPIPGDGQEPEGKGGGREHDRDRAPRDPHPLGEPVQSDDEADHDNREGQVHAVLGDRLAYPGHEGGRSEDREKEKPQEPPR